ncbi:MAG: hypothetical protein RLZZ164_257 [Actinomycetota bacterium]|jgi:hypothetical protein
MTVWQWLESAIWTSVPTVGVFLLFVLMIRSIVRADRKERDAYSKLEAQIRAEREAAKSVKPAAKKAAK